MEAARIDRRRGADRRVDAAVIWLMGLCLVLMLLLWVAAARKPQQLRWLLLMMLVYACMLACCPASAADGVRIPAESVRYRMQLQRAAGERWGLDAPVARVAAQLQQESGWDPSARSIYAQGLAQFMPTTAEWLPSICPSIGKPDPWDPDWSIRAVVCYDGWLFDRAPGATPCDRWAMTLSAYNGGEGARDREIRLAYHARDEPPVWFGLVARVQSRSAVAWHENREYVRRILLVLEPAYLAADWPGTRVCP